jgi:hypothetical protein
MTVSSTDRIAGPFPGDGATDDFPFTMRLFVDTDISAKLTDDDTGEITALTLGSDYTVAVNADQRTDPGGVLTMLTAPAVGETLNFTTALVATQGARLTNAGGFYPEVVENALDKLTILFQQLGIDQTRLIRAPFPETLDELPNAADRALKLVGFDADGNLVVSAPTSGDASDLALTLASSGGSALLGFIQSGAGAVARTMQAKGREVYSVQDTGAVGDGSADDTAEFVAAGTGTTGPIFVPWTSSYYALTALTDALRARLWGPGEVRVNGTVTQINSLPPTVSVEKAMLNVRNDALAPDDNTTLGSVGRGQVYVRGTRTGGFGQYGNATFEYRVTPDNADGELDVGLTSWVSMDGGMVDGAGVFGSWAGANSPPFGESWAGGGVVGLEVNVGNRHTDWGLLADVGSDPYTVGLQLVPDVIPTSVLASRAVTMTSGTPGVVNFTAHGLAAYTPIRFRANGGTLPAAITENTVYYVSSAGLNTDDFRLTATLGGADINFASSSTGSPYALPSYPGSFAMLVGPSIWGHRWHVGEIVRYDTIMAGGYVQQLSGGSSASYNVPAALTRALGYFVNGLDLSGANFSNAALKIGSGATVAGASVGGGDATPATVAGYVKLDVGGVSFGIPYYPVP